MLGILEFVHRYNDEQACWERLVQARWPHGFTCPACHEREHWGFIRTRKLFQCHACGHQASVTAGTILQDTKLSLRTWFLAAYLVYTTKKGISSYELARKLATTQKTAYYLQQKLAVALEHAPTRQLFGLVEIDETFLGHKGIHAGRATDRHAVLGMVENTGTKAGRVHLAHVPNTKRASLEPHVLQRVQTDTVVRTDGWAAYHALSEHGYTHDIRVQDHYLDAIEDLPWAHIVFANLKRVMNGVHTKAHEKTLQAYLDLFIHRFNHRSNLDQALAHGLTLAATAQPVTRAQLQARQPPWTPN